MFNLLYDVEALLLVYDSKATVISAAHHAVILKAETAIDRKEWMAKLLIKAQGGKGSSPVKGSSNGTTPTMRTSLSDGSLVCVLISVSNWLLKLFQTCQ